LCQYGIIACYSPGAREVPIGRGLPRLLVGSGSRRLTSDLRSSPPVGGGRRVDRDELGLSPATGARDRAGTEFALLTQVGADPLVEPAPDRRPQRPAGVPDDSGEVGVKGEGIRHRGPRRFGARRSRHRRARMECSPTRSGRDGRHHGREISPDPRSGTNRDCGRGRTPHASVALGPLGVGEEAALEQEGTLAIVPGAAKGRGLRPPPPPRPAARAPPTAPSSGCGSPPTPRAARPRRGSASRADSGRATTPSAVRRPCRERLGALTGRRVTYPAASAAA